MLQGQSKRFLSTIYKNINFTLHDKVALIQLNRPSALNSLNSELVNELLESLKKVEATDSISCVVLTGNSKSFAAGADIEEMSKLKFSTCLMSNFLANWANIAKFRKPLIAAVNGYALGGGFELAMMCDVIYAGKNAKFGLPEIKLGTIPGGGGTQRLIRLIGKSNAMELTLSGRHIKAEEAFRLGIVSKIFEDGEVLDECIKLAKEISNHSLPAVISCKESILKAEDFGLSSGLDYERNIFHSTFALEDREEGMKSFIQKRKANFCNK